LFTKQIIELLFSFVGGSCNGFAIDLFLDEPTSIKSYFMSEMETIDCKVHQNPTRMRMIIASSFVGGALKYLWIVIEQQLTTR